MEEVYPGLYQNFITKRLLVHPTEDRFYSDDLNKALQERNFLIKDAIESKRLGILGVAVKEMVNVQGFKVQGSAPPVADQAASLIEKETSKL